MKLSEKIAKLTFHGGVTYFMTSAIIKTGLIISSLISPPQSEFNDQIYFFKRDKGNPES